MGSKLKLLIMYIITSAIIYGAFWLGFYFLSFAATLVISLVLVAWIGIMFAALRHKTWPAIFCALGLGFVIGLSLSAIFTALNLPASKFLGLTLIIMIGYKGMQLCLSHLIHKRLVQNIVNAFIVIMEIIAIVTIMASPLDISVRYQLLCTGLVSIFYSFGIFALFNSSSSDFWRTAAICYFIGFVIIFVVVVLIIFCAITEDGSPFEGFGDFISGAASGSVSPSSTKKKKIVNGQP